MNYKDYFKHHEYTHSALNYEKSDKSIARNIHNVMMQYEQDAFIVEIGSGQGKFAYFCKKRNFKHYLGFELDNDTLEKTSKKFPGYTFCSDDVFSRLRNNKDSVDIIFMSHVLEHMSLKEGLELSQLIHKSLKPGGIWINFMPNAATPFFSGYGRYNDITHKTLYTENSFNQILLGGGFDLSKIIHQNTKHGGMTFFAKFFFLSLLKFLCRISGTGLKRIYTFEILSFIKK